MLLPLLIKKDRYLALLLVTAKKQQELEVAAAEKQQKQQKEPAAKKTAIGGTRKETMPGFLKRGVPGFLAKQTEPKAAPKPKEEPGSAQLKLFAVEVCRLYAAIAQYLIIGAAKMTSSP